MHAEDRSLHDDAIAWAARVQDGAFDDWEGHAQWLAADPRNPERYVVAVLALEDGVAQILLAPHTRTAAANDDAPMLRSRGRRPWLFAATAALAASILAVISLPTNAGIEVLSVPAGAKREATLPDGTVLALNGDTKVSLIARRRISVDRGEAFVRVRHDPQHPFEVIAGGKVYRDVGTSFNVIATNGIVRFQVADGIVIFDPDGAALIMHAGEGLSVADGKVSRTTNASSSIGGWRSGRLVYRNANLVDVADDLSRLYGRNISVAAGLQDAHFSGIVTVPERTKPSANDIGELLGVRVVDSAGRWSFEKDF